MVKTLSLLFAFGTLFMPTNDALVESKNAGYGESITQVQRSSDALYGEKNYTVLNETEGGVPTRFDKNEGKERKKYSHRTKDIKPCDRQSNFALEKRYGLGEGEVRISVEKWTIEFTPNGYRPSTLDEPPTISK